MIFLEERALYTDTDHCLQTLEQAIDRQPAASPGEPAIWHAYWFGEVGPKQVLSLKSALATQNPATTQVWLWLDEQNGYAGHEENPYLRPILPLLTVRPFNPRAEFRGTPLDVGLLRWRARRRLHRLAERTDNLAKRADLFRVTVLHNHGGLYFDLDILFLRDFAGLDAFVPCDTEYAYQWSNQAYANTAILQLQAGSPLARQLLEEAAATGEILPWELFRFREGLPLTILPSAFFDPLWQDVDGIHRSARVPLHSFAAFFDRTDDPAGLDTFCGGAFAHHWHNQWAAAELRHSYAGRLNAEIDEILRVREGIHPCPTFMA